MNTPPKRAQAVMSSREALQIKLDSLVWDKERLEAENARLRDEDPERAEVVDLQAETERYRRENERLLKDLKKLYKGQERELRRSIDPTQMKETELLVEQQRQVCEDLQAELAEAAERSCSLEDRCCQLKEEIQCTRVEAELAQLRELDSLRRKSEEREERLVRQVRELQESVRELQLQLRPVQSHSSAAATTHEKTPLDHHTEATGEVSSVRDKIVIAAAERSERVQTDSAVAVAASVNTEKHVGHPPDTKEPPTASLANALLAQQLPPLPKFSGGEQAQEEPFKEWLAQFELTAEVCSWSKRAKLIHLTTRLRGEAFAFYRSCTLGQKSDYDRLVAELSQRFTPVRIQSVQTSMFHDRKQKEKETVDAYAQELKALFYKAYPQVQEGDGAAESMGRSVLSSQFVAGLLPPLKSKLAGVEGDFEKLLVKARFEEAKLREFAGARAVTPSRKVSFNPQNKPDNNNQSAEPISHNQSAGPSHHPMQGLRCDVCDSPNHLRRRCPFRNRGAPREARGSNRRVSAVVRLEADSHEPPCSQEEEVESALEEATALMHGVATKETTGTGQLGPVLTVDVALEGEMVSALVDTGSPVTIVSLNCLIKLLDKKRRPDQSPAEWRKSVEQRMVPPSMSLFCYGGGKLNLVKQMEVTLSRAGYTSTAIVQIQSGAPVDLLLGTDQLPYLGFGMTACNADGSTQDLLQKPPLSQNDQKTTIPSSVHEHTTVHLVQAARLPALHQKMVRARVSTLPAIDALCYLSLPPSSVEKMEFGWLTLQCKCQQTKKLP